jgi:hypothetical protein
MSASRRAVLVGTAALAAVAPATAGPVEHPDAKLIRNAAAFIEHQAQIQAHADRLCDDMTPQGRADWQRLCCASETRFFERLEAISVAEPSTREGLLAQARVVLWEFNEDDHDAHHTLAWNLAESVFRVLGEPLPSWSSATVEV